MITCAVIPTYNNRATVADIVRRTLVYLPVIVVADGPTDGSLEAVQAIDDERLTIVAYPQNRGKGYALRQGLSKAREVGYTHALTIDSDGQHFPEDIPALLRLSAVRPEAIIIGSRGMKHDNMPGKNTFANKFSNFWFALQTGMRLPDTQTGLRVYPLEHVRGMRLMTRRYEAELMLLVFSAWASVPILPVPVRVYYPPQEERVSYFRPAKDFTRISVLNTMLCLLALVYGLPRRFWRTVWYVILFLLFALRWNINLLLYSMFCPKRISTSYRRRLGLSTRRFLAAFPRATFSVKTEKGAEALDFSQPAIYIANHGSLLDTLLMLSLSEKTILVGKNWVAHNPIFGKVSQAIGFVNVEHGVEEMVPTVRRYMEQDYSICIFPEGTRSLDGELLRFHRGAFYLAEQLHVPIRPLVLRGFLRALKKKPFFVGAPTELTAVVKPLIMPDDTSYGSDYRERTKTLQHFYREWITETC